MTDLRKAAEMAAYEVPLHELLEGVPENARLVIDSEDGMSTRFIPVGHLCKRAAGVLRQALSNEFNPDWNQVEALQESLREHMAEIQRLRQAIAQPEQESVACVYKATNHYGETAHFGVRSAAKAWAKNGTVKAVPIKNLKLVQKPCLSCESLARTVMLDQTYHENIIEQQKQKPVVYQCPRCAASMEINTMAKPSLPKREWVGLTGFEQKELMKMNARDAVFATEAKLKEKNT